MSKVVPRQKLFGTDGVRGVANVEPLTAETALKLGRAAAYVFKREPSRGHSRHKIVIGKDTRLSGYMIENAMTGGVLSMGVDVLLIGPLPSPGVAYITHSLRADAGIMLTASHNSYEDNGIKFFYHDGYKLDDALEKEIEDLVFSGAVDDIRPTATEIGKAYRIDDALGRYIEFVKSSFPRGMKLDRMKIVVDAAHGAAYKSSPCVLQELGAQIFVLGNTPDGTNINEGGSLHPSAMQATVLKHGADVGSAHDGDADRVIMCDEKGQLVDGDEILAIAALDFLANRTLANNTLVTTVMSNLGLDETIQAAGGRVVRTAVGDRYVIEEMKRLGANVGGEQSGHIILRDWTTTGDGIISALQILRVMKTGGKPLSELRACLCRYPQVALNIPVRAKPPLSELPEVIQLVRDAEHRMAEHGRVLLRYSGTEPVARVLVEGREWAEIEPLAQRIAEAVRKKIGA